MRRAKKAVAEQYVVPVAVNDDIRADPDEKYGKSDQNAPDPVARDYFDLPQPADEAENAQNKDLKRPLLKC